MHPFCYVSQISYDIEFKAMERIREDSSGEARSDASSYIRLLEDPQFIVALTVAQAILSFLDPVTKAKDCDLTIAYKDVRAFAVYAKTIGSPYVVCTI